MSGDKQVWIVVGEVTDTDGYEGSFLGQTEYQFSDGPAGSRGGSSDYIDLAKGLRDHSGYIIHWCESN
jgi:hypothetical protein